MRRVIVVLIAAAALSACAGNKSAYPKKDGVIRLVQYNVGAFAKYEGSGIESIAGLIKELDADIVSLNELDSCNRRHDTNQCADLAAELGGWDHLFARAMAFSGGSYGNGIVSRERMIPAEPIALDRFDGSEPRCAAVGETSRFVFVSTHLDFKDSTSTEAQARQLTAAIKARYASCGKAVFLAGDMNSLPGSRVLSVLKEDWDLISGEPLTFPCPGATKTIDYIFALKNGVAYKVARAEVPHNLEAEIDSASDHYPVFADIGL